MSTDKHGFHYSWIGHSLPEKDQRKSVTRIKRWIHRSLMFSMFICVYLWLNRFLGLAGDSRHAFETAFSCRQERRALSNLDR